MALNIKNDEAERLARRLAKRTGKSITRVLIDALRAEEAATGGPAQPVQLGERPAPADLAPPQPRPARLYDRLMALTNEMAARSSGDRTDPDDVIGYDDHGVPR